MPGIVPRTVGPLFCATGQRAISLRLVNHIVQSVGESAGVTNPNPGRAHLNPHIFRHSIARFLKQKGFKRRVDSEFPRPSVLPNHHRHVWHHLH